MSMVNSQYLVEKLMNRPWVPEPSEIKDQFKQVELKGVAEQLEDLDKYF